MDLMHYTIASLCQKILEIIYMTTILFHGGYIRFDELYFNFILYYY